MINFPDAPVDGEEFQDGPNTWVWDSVKWTSAALSPVVGPYLPLTGGDLTGPLTGTDATFSGDVDGEAARFTQAVEAGWGFYARTTTGDVGVTVDVPVGQNATLGGAKSGKTRWTLVLGDTAPEPGDGSGSDLIITRYDDAGSSLSPPLTIARVSGGVTMSSGHLNITGGASSTLTLYRTSNILSDDNYFAVGLSGPAQVVTNWRDMFTRPSGQRDWLDFSNVPLMKLVGGGNLTITGTLSQASDARGKRDIKEATDGIEQVRLMSPKRYTRIHPTPPADQPGWAVPEREELGFIAQELQGAQPDAVVEDDEGKLAVSLMPLIATLTNAVKQIDARLVALEGGAPAREVTVNTVNVQPTRASPPRNGRKR